MSEFHFDRLKAYFGKPLEVSNGMHVYVPYIGDILDLDDSDITFYQTLYVWIANPTTYRLMLWDNGIDWNKLSNYELFLMLYRTSNPDVTRLLFGDEIDLSKFQFFTKVVQQDDLNDETDEPKTEIVLYDQDDDIEISSEDYEFISEYLKAVFNIYPKVEKAKGKLTKESIIEEERMNLIAKQRNGEDKPSSTLLPLVSSCLNHPGFKYDLEGLKHVNFVQFMDSVQRLQIYENTTALLKGVTGGFADASKLKKDELNFMRDISPSK